MADKIPGIGSLVSEPFPLLPKRVSLSFPLGRLYCAFVCAGHGFGDLRREQTGSFTEPNRGGSFCGAIAANVCPSDRQGFSIAEGGKASLTYIEDHLDQAKVMYVYYASCSTLEFYNRTGRFLMEDKLKIIRGTGNRGNKSEYLAEMDVIAEPFWLVISHPYRDEERFIVKKLKEKRMVHEAYQTKGSLAYLVGAKES
jgi:hypothetical protein